MCQVDQAYRRQRQPPCKHAIPWLKIGLKSGLIHGHPQPLATAAERSGDATELANRRAKPDNELAATACVIGRRPIVRPLIAAGQPRITVRQWREIGQRAGLNLGL
jgi:hypothetical protein